MGFSTTGLIVAPTRPLHLPRGVILWEPVEVLNVGYIDRRVQSLEAKQTSHVSDRIDPLRRVGTAFISLVLKRLPAYARKNPGRLNAPPFFSKQVLDPWEDVLFLRAIGISTNEWESLRPGDQRLLTFDGRGLDEFPERDWQARHNRAVASGKRRRGIILEFPLCWVPCRVLGRWMDEFWQSSSMSRMQINRDRIARARLEGWHGQLRAYGKLHAKVLFVFAGLHMTLKKRAHLCARFSFYRQFRMMLKKE